jgi:hypothetical protein
VPPLQYCLVCCRLFPQIWVPQCLLDRRPARQGRRRTRGHLRRGGPPAGVQIAEYQAYRLFPTGRHLAAVTCVREWSDRRRGQRSVQVSFGAVRLLRRIECLSWSRGTHTSRPRFFAVKYGRLSRHASTTRRHSSYPSGRRF